MGKRSLQTVDAMDIRRRTMTFPDVQSKAVSLSRCQHRTCSSSMNYDDAYQRLKNHANLPNDLPEELSICWTLWKIHSTGSQADLTSLLDDIMECLECINRYFNGAVPSETSDSGKCSVADRWLLYSIQCILQDGFTKALLWRRTNKLDEGFIEHVEEVFFAIGCAWEAVLAGDIDSLSTHVSLERRCLTLDP